jgi:hydrogenase-4 membrane subunit HyfE
MMVYFDSVMVTTGLAVCFLLATFLGTGKFRLGQLLRYYAIQSLFLAAMFVSMARGGDEHLYFSALGVVAFKVILIPVMLSAGAQRSNVSGRLTSLIRPTPTYFISGLTLLLAVAMAMSISSALIDTDLILTISAFSAMFLGASMMATRLDLYSQIIGFLSFENGISLLASATLGAIPLLAEIGIFFTITIGALLMSILSRRLKELYAVEDTGELRELVD